MTEVLWGRLRADQLRELAARDALVVATIGATEQHGPHLPTLTDHRLVSEIAARAARIAAEQMPVVVLPVLPFGLSAHHVPYGGTITLDLAAFHATFRCILRSLTAQGFRRLFVLNGHGGNTEALRVVIGDLSQEFPAATIGCATYWDLAADVIGEIATVQGNVLHACEVETSMVWALEPDLVDPERAKGIDVPVVPGASAIAGANAAAYRWRSFASRTPNGVIGHPSASSAEKGARFLDAISSRVAEAFADEAYWSAPT